MSERRNVDELLARYVLEPTLRDLYVEGASDRRFFDWLLREFGLSTVVAYEIESVNVPHEMLRPFEVEDNNRGRVIALAYYLHQHTGTDLSQRVACIADRDFDDLLGIRFDCPLLILTDYTAVELYCLDEAVLQKFLTLVVDGFKMTAREVLEAMLPVLRELFTVRLANRVLSLGLSELSFEKCCSVKGRTITFDLDEYVTRYLNKSGKAAQTRCVHGKSPGASRNP